MSRNTDRKPERQAHRNHTRRYWKERAQEEKHSGRYSEENLTRMRRGLAPRRLALLRSTVTGETVEFHAPIELHHVFGISGDYPQEEQTIIELYPWDHAACDEERNFSWKFVQWVGFQ